MEYYSQTDIGRKRKSNQDNYMVRRFGTEVLLSVVCDGMGGTGGGEEASRIAVCEYDRVLSVFVRRCVQNGAAECPTSDVVFSEMKRAAQAANRAVFEAAKASPELSGMGTTLVSCLVLGSAFFSLNVGDSRLYFESGGRMKQITKDHSFVQHLIDIGQLTPERAKTSANRNIITRAVGIEQTVEADVFRTPVPDTGGNILLCTDGLCGLVEDRQTAKVMASPGQTPEQKVKRLVSLALAAGGRDNITAVLIKL